MNSLYPEAELCPLGFAVPRREPRLGMAPDSPDSEKPKFAPAYFRFLRSTASWVVGLLFASAVGASAATFYVSPSGSDSNPGTATQPWRNMQKSMTAATQGDTIVVRPGVYDERVTVTTPGLTYRAEPGVTNRSTFWIRAADITVDGFEMTCDGSTAVYSTAVFFGFTGVANCRIINNYIHDTPVIYPRGSIEFDTSSGSTTAHSCIISNNTFRNFGGWVSFKGRGHIAVNNTFYNSYGTGAFRVQGQDHIVRGNTSSQIGSGIIRVEGAANPAFNGQYFDYTSLRLSTSPSYSVWTNAHGYHAVRSDALWKTKGWSNVVNILDPTHTKVYASASRFDAVWTMHDPIMGSAFTRGIGAIEHPDWIECLGPIVYPTVSDWSRTASNILVEHNFIFNCPGGSVMNIGANYTNLPGPVIDWTFRNNIWSGVEVPATVQVPRTKFYNNTFFQCTTQFNAPILNFGLYHTNHFDPRGMALYSEVKFNAFIGCGRSSGAGWYAATAVGQWSTNPWPSFPFDTVLTNCNYNFVADINGAPKSQGSGYPVTTRFAFSEPNGINGGNANYIDPLAGDFRIGPGSSLTNSGVLIGASFPLLSTQPIPVRPNPPTGLRILATP